MFPRLGLPAALAGTAVALSLGGCVTTTPPAATIEPVALQEEAAAEPPLVGPDPGVAAPTDQTLADQALADQPPASPTTTEQGVVEVPRVGEGAPPAAVSAAALAALAREEQEARNAEVVVAFYEMVFRDHLVAEAIERFGDDVYIQHTPGAPDGWDALEAYLVPYFRANPLARSEIQRVVAQGDLVVLHVLAKTDPVDRGRAVVDIFRVENGKIVEHWDVVQPIPPATANDNTMF